jgi:hypothetical protein
MPKKIVLHIGMHKTGSSSIQKSLADFDDGKTRFAQLGQANHSVPLFTIFSERRFERRHFTQKGYSPTKLKTILADFENQLDHELSLDRDTLIISAEDLSILKSKRDVAAMKKRLEEYTRDIQVIAYIRDPVGFCSSSFQQRVRVGYSQYALPLPGYRNRYEPYISVFGAENIDFVRFAPDQFPENSVVADFFARTKIESGLVTEKSANSTLSDAATRLLFLFNKKGPLASGNQMVLTARQKTTIALRKACKSEPNFKFPKELILANEALHEDLEWLHENTGIHFKTDKVQSLELTEIAKLVQAKMAVTEADVTKIKVFCRKNDIKIPKNASALMTMSLLFYNELYTLGQKSMK